MMDPASSNSSFVFEGWLYKKGRIHKNWKRRWMVLQGTALSYSSQPGTRNIKGVIPLQGCEVCKCDDCGADGINQPQIPSSAPGANGGSLLFVIKTLKGRAYYLKSENEPEMEKWVVFIKQASLTAPGAEGIAEQTSSTASPLIASLEKNATAANSTASASLTRFVESFRRGKKEKSSQNEGRYLNLYKRYKNEKQHGKVFGTSLEELTAREESGLKVPIIIHRIIQYLDQDLCAEGLFRLSGGAAAVRCLKHGFDTCTHYQEQYSLYKRNNTLKIIKGKDSRAVAFPEDRSSGPHTVTSLLKLYIKELPEPLAPEPVYKEFLDIQSKKDTTEEFRLRSFRSLLSSLPEVHLAVLRAICNLLFRVAQHSHINQMTPKNLAICLAPNIFRSTEKDLLTSMQEAPLLLGIMKSFITQAVFLFSEGEEDLSLIDRDRKSMRTKQAPLQPRVEPIPATAGPSIKPTSRGDCSLLWEIDQFVADFQITIPECKPPDHVEDNVLLEEIDSFLQSIHFRA